ncbi:hypothetical protein niasHS_004082 [Heterodera schachtii]|uniref:Transmembrane protein n=1 Tax=Heterodera schachtii TaxID=97005 RepID=A0ABD2JUK4_HETSC
MPLKFSLFLFIFIDFVGTFAGANWAQQRKLCSNRCHRLLKRSLERNEQAGTVEEVLYRTVAYSRQQLLASLEEGSKEAPAKFEQLPEPFQNICWKFFDFEDCSRQCEKAFFRRRKRKNGQKTMGTEEEEKDSSIGREQRMVLRFCRENKLSIPHEYFLCIHKFHAFVEVRCSSYQQKAVQLRLLALQIRRRQMPVDEFDSDDEDGTASNADEAYANGGHDQLGHLIDQEVCLLLHQHSTCLGNALGRHCPLARSLFTSRHALRDNFLSFVLPFGTAVERNAKGAEPSANSGATIELDQLFSDEMLDTCQLLDFNRMMAQWQEQQKDGVSTNSPHHSAQGDQQQKKGNEFRRGTTKRAVGTLPTAEADGTTTSAEGAAPSGTLAGRRRLFSSDEDLLDIPPNFQYSSARLPPDFYTRYAIWWGGRSRAQSVAAHPTRVQLLPDATQKGVAAANAAKVDQHLLKRPHTTPKTRTTTETPPVTATRATWPDAMLSTTQLPDARETVLVERPAELYHSVSLPYLINGQATVPHKQWTATEQATAAVSRRTEIQLLSDDRQQLLTSATGGSGVGITPTHTVTAPTRSLDTHSPAEFKIQKVPNDADEKDGDRMPTNWPPHGIDDSEQLQQLRTDANNVYFAKILEFDDEEEEDSTGRAVGRTTPQGARVTAYIEHIPRDEQAKPMQPQNDAVDHPYFEEEAKAKKDKQLLDDSSAAEDDDYFEDDDENDDLYTDESTEGQHDIRHRISNKSPGSALPIATNEASRGLADLSSKTRAPIGGGTGGRRPPPTSNDSPRRFVVTAEPVPSTHSDVLLVLLGLYGTFFGVAAFLLLCLLLACLERRRRRHGTALMGRHRRKYWLKNRASSAKKGGSAILYLDERLGTVKGGIGTK